MRHRPAALATLLGIFAGTAMAGEGLSAPPGETLWPRWQSRVTTLGPSGGALFVPWSLSADAGSGYALTNASWFGDYYFDSFSLRPPSGLGGLRATGGLVFGGRMLSSLGEPAVDRALAAPYVGLGYTGLSASRSWGISADLGLLPESTDGRRLLGGQAQDRSLRELRLSPWLQLGVHYAF